MSIESLFPGRTDSGNLGRWSEDSLESGTEIVIGPAYTQLSDEIAGRYSLYTHQVALSEDPSNVVLLDAPTGSGKTLAALKRVLDRSSPAIFVYPTNSLVKNQVDAIADLLEGLGHTPNIIDSESSVNEIQSRMEQTSIDVIHLTGEALEALADREGGAKGGIIDAILTGTHKEGRMRLLLTNPDTIYLAFINRYKRSGRIFEQLESFKTLVLDEFHLYSGPLLARIIFLVNVLIGNQKNPAYDLVFLSATHGDTLDLLRSTYSRLSVIEAPPVAEEPPKGRQIRYPTRCRVMSLTRVLTDDAHVADAADEIVSLYDADFDGAHPQVKVLGIFSSVSFAIRVAQRVREILAAREDGSEAKVRQLHGFIPRAARGHVDDTNTILIGTSAIEVGIDFDVPFLVFEAHDVGSFLQRLGRGGRHNPCTATMFVPQPLADRLAERSDWAFPEVVSQSHEALAELPSYAGFLCSPQAKKILLTMALAANRLPRSHRDRRDRFDWESAADLYGMLLNANKSVSIGSACLRNRVEVSERRRIISDLKAYAVKVMVTHGFLRGAMNSVIALYPASFIGTSTDVYAEMDIFDVFKTRGSVQSAEKHWDRIPAVLKRRHTKEDPVYVMRDVSRSERPKIVLTGDALVRYRTLVYQEPQCHFKHSDPLLSALGQKILNRRNIAFHWRSANRYTDYRIPRLYLEGEDGALVIGDWALVAEYLVWSRKEGEQEE